MFLLIMINQGLIHFEVEIRDTNNQQESPAASVDFPSFDHSKNLFRDIPSKAKKKHLSLLNY